MKEEKKRQKRKTKNPASLKEKMRKHISDKNDIITDDDLKNIQVGEESFTEKTEYESNTLPEEIERESKEIDDAFSKKEKLNPWNILDEDNDGIGKR